jgi:hydroxyacylglutathione hydrolase
MKYHNSIHVTENLFCYIWKGMGNNCNSCVFKGVLKGNKHIIVDPGHITNEAREHCFESLEEAMKSDGIQTEEIGLIVNTHSHPDHCEANEQIIRKSQAGVTLSKEEDEFRTGVGERMYAMFGLQPPHFTPVYYLEEGDLDLGGNGLDVRVILAPGHSPGSVCLYVPDTKVLITGDVVFFMSVGRTDFPGGSELLLKKSLDKLAQLDVEVLIPGHNTEPNGIIRGKEKIQRNFSVVQEFF